MAQSLASVLIGGFLIKKSKQIGKQGSRKSEEIKYGKVDSVIETIEPSVKFFRSCSDIGQKMPHHRHSFDGCEISSQRDPGLIQGEVVTPNEAKTCAKINDKERSGERRASGGN